MKALKLTFSGSYKASNNEIFGFEGIEGVVPFQDKDIAYRHASVRHLPMWISEKAQETNKAISVRAIKNLREKVLDRVEEVEHEFTFEGKDIREMTFEEIQDVALMFNLTEVPVYKNGSLVSQRNALYGIYSSEILKNKLNHKDEFFHLDDFPPIYVGSTPVVKREVKEIFGEIDGNPTLPTQSLEGLKRLADSKGIKYHHRCNYDRLLELINEFDNAQ